MSDISRDDLRCASQQLLADAMNSVHGGHPNGSPLARLVLQYLDKKPEPAPDLEARLRSYVDPDDDSEDRAEIRALMVEAADEIARLTGALLRFESEREEQRLR